MPHSGSSKHASIASAQSASCAHDTQAPSSSSLQLGTTPDDVESPTLSVPLPVVVPPVPDDPPGPPVVGPGPVELESVESAAVVAVVAFGIPLELAVGPAVPLPGCPLVLPSEVPELAPGDSGSAKCEDQRG